MKEIKFPLRMIHVGRKAPKGFVELPGGIHLGKGVWMLPIQKEDTPELLTQDKE